MDLCLGLRAIFNGYIVLEYEWVWNPGGAKLTSALLGLPISAPDFQQSWHRSVANNVDVAG
jgi:hypothetical protein